MNDDYHHHPLAKKKIIVTSGGKNIAPQPIENLIVTSEFVDQVVVLGDKRKYCTAFIVPNMENVKKHAQTHQIVYKNEDDLISHTEICDLIRKEIDRVSGDLASYETIKKFQILKEPFTIESGELTPTLKVKRNVVEQKYKVLIESMYLDDENNN